MSIFVLYLFVILGFNTCTSRFRHVLARFSESSELIFDLQNNVKEAKRLVTAKNKTIKEMEKQKKIQTHVKQIINKISNKKQLTKQKTEYNIQQFRTESNYSVIVFLMLCFCGLILVVCCRLCSFSSFLLFFVFFSKSIFSCCLFIKC